MVDNDTSTVIGESILINGNLQGDEDLTVLGRVEGTVNLTKTLNVEESGIVKANISVRNAIISGVVVGNINATESVEITEVGRMVGDIKAPRVIIVDGARYRGAVDMGDLESPRSSVASSSPRNERALVSRPVSTTPRMSIPSAPIRRPSPPPAPAPAPAPAPIPRRSEPSKPMITPTPVPATAPVVMGAKKIKKKVVSKKK
ncbi:MAG: polymer-forming cytoskeletal protein [Deltaproteobacteria bacterium]|nr:polymer-forming cytoskeletal protein [Deltaproteobacteria bacterium]